jgi:hypothetical protein
MSDKNNTMITFIKHILSVAVENINQTIPLTEITIKGARYIGNNPIYLMLMKLNNSKLYCHCYGVEIKYYRKYCALVVKLI